MAKIYAKRASASQDDEAWKLTDKVLLENPDIATLWNYRREMLSAALPTKSKEETIALLNKELSLLEQCLRVNPKSYCIWLHRRWVMTHSPAPDWTRDKSLCDLFLKHDERNFHCWDYRRFVVSQAGITPEEEFAFSYSKIASNFSNYSAWHYRSKLLPQLRPGSKPGTVDGTALAQEFELVQNAFFTDPSDQSAWFYHRWLLGKEHIPLQITGLLLRRLPNPSLFIVLNRPVKTGSTDVTVSVVDTTLNCSKQSDWPESLWNCPIPSDIVGGNERPLSVSVQLGPTKVTLNLAGNQLENWWTSKDGLFGTSTTVVSTERLHDELKMCQELLELEPENKWCLLTTVALMQAVDTPGYATDIERMVAKLVSADSNRSGYYKDLLSKFRIELALRDSYTEPNGTLHERCLDLSNKQLTRLYHAELMCLYQTVILMTNQLCHLHGVGCLVSVVTLVLDGNRLESLPESIASLPQLKSLSVKHNMLSQLDSLKGSGVESIWLEGNPINDRDDLLLLVRLLLPNLKVLNNQVC